MKIENATPSKGKFFRNIDVGEVFQYNDKYFMRMREYDKNDFNAVQLDNGYPCRFEDTTKVIDVSGKFILD